MTSSDGNLRAPDDGLYRHWQRLNHWLHEYQALWRSVPFMEPEPAWTGVLPELAHWLQRLDDNQCNHYEQDPASLVPRLLGWVPGLADYPALVSVPDLSPGPTAVNEATLAEKNAVDMPGRKRLQAGAFTAALIPLSEQALDWCCGKGHLSRTLASQAGTRVTGYEWNPGLVTDGNRLVQRYGDPVTLHCQDVMAVELPWPEGAHGLALHACGDLHRKLIQDVVSRRQPRVSFSPCCYHLTSNATFSLLSDRGRDGAHRLSLSRDDLRLAVQETVTAPRRDRRQSTLMSHWRLGFDSLQRWVWGEDEYLSLPPHPKRLMREGFEAFCQWAAEQKGLHLPPGIDFHHWLGIGIERAERVRRYELLRHVFRRPLELWLVLDYGLCLEEAGYSVRIGTFCDRALTPRNLLVDATRIDFPASGH